MNTLVHSTGSSQAVKGPPLQDSNQVDIWLVGTVLVLLTFGLVMVYSATVASESQTLAVNFAPTISHLIHIL